MYALMRSTAVMPVILATLSLGWLFDIQPARADEPPAQASPESDTADLEAGHSMHGEAFNEGPRQAAYLMEGMGNIQFDISTSQPLAKKFFNQGVAQLHGFWYYEAERSFRQAATLDPDCAMCYWGMALANVNNRKRAEGFIAKAVERKSNASPREQLYIQAASRRFQEPTSGKKPSKKEIAQNYTRDLEEIVLKYPDDIEGRALLALQLWENERNDLPLVSHVAVDAVLEDVFDQNPMHPAHHYRIHLWDKRQPSQALRSAALCGPSLPGIAHMWHMPGHTYSNLHRFQDAVWQQEASARVDHAHMMRDRIMPDQIHNFAHNNEWMIRNLQKIGRIDDAVDLATNMIQLPRHPKFNSLKGGSAKYGRERLLQSLALYRLWPELIAAIESNLIEAGDTDELQIERSRHLGVSHAMLGHAKQTAEVLEDLNARLKKVNSELGELEHAEQAGRSPLAALPEAGQPPRPAESRSASQSSSGGAPAATCDDQPAPDKATASADAKKAAANRQRREKETASRKKELQPRQKQLKEAVAAIEAAQAATDQQWQRAAERFDAAGNWDKLLKAEWLAHAGKTDAALELVKAEIKQNPGTVLPTAVEAFVLWRVRGAKDAAESFERLRDAACASDLDTPLLARLEKLAAELGVDAKWAKPPRNNSDIGSRPALDSLGPFRYSPYQAPSWKAVTSQGKPVDSSRFAGRPVIVIFYLGFGCLHCMEQLQKFSPAASAFREQGIDLVAISTETPKLLAQGLKNFDKELHIPLVADPELEAFKAFRCFDDFEKQPLHGTFLIDPAGRVLWQDISYDPFQDDAFLLKEAQRLLSLRRD